MIEDEALTVYAWDEVQQDTYVHPIHYIREALGMTMGEFVSEWKHLSDADKEWYQEAAKAERKFMERKVKVATIFL